MGTIIPTTTDPASLSLQLEAAAGRRLVIVGFMSRYDDGYRAMKEALDCRWSRKLAHFVRPAEQEVAS